MVKWSVRVLKFRGVGGALVMDVKCDPARSQESRNAEMKGQLADPGMRCFILTDHPDE